MPMDYYSKVPSHGASQTSGASREAEMKTALAEVRSDYPSRKERQKLRDGRDMIGNHTPMGKGNR